MSSGTQPAENNLPPDEFIDEIKDALEHLYDYPYLQKTTLLARMGEPENAFQNSLGQRLREEILSAIESLNPGQSVTFRAPNARLYNLLHLRYVEGISVQQSAHELGISERQAHRDLRRAEEGVATLLWSKWSAASSKGTARQLSSLEAEMAQLQTEAQAFDLHTVLQNVLSAVSRLAEQRGVKIVYEQAESHAIVYTNPVLAQQTLTSLISHAVQHSQPGKFTVRPGIDKAGYMVEMVFDPADEAVPNPMFNDTILQLIERLEWKTDQQMTPEEQCIIQVRVTGVGPMVLVIDDNSGLVDLLVHYLSSHACQVVAATTGQQGARLASELVPDAILLDIMMPHMDGWEVLQRLQNHPITQNIPVIICSVIHDPELAYSLGAAAVVAKPVRRDDILAALHELDIL